VEWLKADDLLSKIITNVVVVIINYVASKQIIFKK
jgi:putative flippase GtrA